MVCQEKRGEVLMRLQVGEKACEVMVVVMVPVLVNPHWDQAKITRRVKVRKLPGHFWKRVFSTGSVKSIEMATRREV